MNKTKVPFLDLKRAFSEKKNEFLTEIERICSSGYFILGNELEDFENLFANMCGAKYCIGVGNGLDALSLTLKAWITLGKLNPGDEVIVPANTFIASVIAITSCGLIPKFIDPDPRTFNMKVEDVSKNITKKTKIIMCVHLYGSLCPIALRQLADDNNIFLLEDAAQAHFAEASGLVAGNIGHAAGFSFYPGKNLGALGDGGAITTSDKELAITVRKLRNYGSSSKYINDYVGINSRLDPIQAVILRSKLSLVKKHNQRRRAIAQKYVKEIHENHLILPKCKLDQEIADDLSHVWHLFVVKVKDRSSMIKHLDKSGIETLIHYPLPPHKQAAYKQFSNQYLPITEKLSSEVLSLPLNPWMRDQEIAYVISAINKFN